MAVGSGLAASFGLAQESTYNTYVAPSRFHRFTKAEIKDVENTVQGGGLAAGALAQPASYHVTTTTAGTGSLEMEASTNGLGLLLQNIFGSSVTPTLLTGSAYSQTHAFADNVGKSITAQLGVPSRTGTVVPHTGTGGKIASAEFSCGVDELLMLSAEFDFAGFTRAQSLAAPSYTATKPFHFRQMAVKLGTTVGGVTAVNGIKKASVKIERPHDTEAFYANANGTKAEQIMNDYAKVSATFDVDYLNAADFEDRYSNQTQTAIVIEFIGATISGGNSETLRFTIPAAFAEGDTQGVDGAGVQSTSFTFNAQLDALGSALVTATYISTDSTL